MGAVIASVVYDMAAGVFRGRSPFSIVILLASFAATCFFGVNAVIVILVCIALGLVQALWEKRKGGAAVIYLQLLLSFLQIGLFSFGGGYAALPLIQDQIVSLHGWLSMEEFTDLITISQMTPGPIAINAATFVGQKIAGAPGAIVATLGCVLPSCVIVTLIAGLYLKYRTMRVLQSVLNTLRPAVVALIASAGVSILLTAFWGTDALISLAGTDWSMVVIFAAGFALLRWAKWNPHPRHGARRRRQARIRTHHRRTRLLTRLRRAIHAPGLCLCPASHARGCFRVRASVFPGKQKSRLLFPAAGRKPAGQKARPKLS